MTKQDFEMRDTNTAAVHDIAEAVSVWCRHLLAHKSSNNSRYQLLNGMITFEVGPNFCIVAKMIHSFKNNVIGH